jgi:hypothetical protein
MIRPTQKEQLAALLFPKCFTTHKIKIFQVIQFYFKEITYGIQTQKMASNSNC